MKEAVPVPVEKPAVRKRAVEQAAVAAREFILVSRMVDEYVHLVALVSGEIVRVKGVIVSPTKGWVHFGDEIVEARVVVDIAILGQDCTAYGMTPEEALDDLVDHLDQMRFLGGFVRSNSKKGSEDVADVYEQVELVDNEDLLEWSGVRDPMLEVEARVSGELLEAAGSEALH